MLHIYGPAHIRGGEGRGGEGNCMIYLVIPKVLHTDINIDPPSKRVLEELSLLKSLTCLTQCDYNPIVYKLKSRLSSLVLNLQYFVLGARQSFESN